ncbi:hypothetical protein Tco_0230455, partial [Tanacetum coccineum]
TSALSISSVRDERIAGSTARAFRQRLYKTDKYGYIKNHKKTIKSKQARIQERKSKQKPEAKPEKVKPTVTSSQTMVNKSQQDPKYST